jgi:sugar O-acyltransferase (sialic acid O-acetyltransferase NeuD family)
MAAQLEKILIVGAGGHGRVILDLVLASGVFEVAGFVDSHISVGTRVLSSCVLGAEADLPALCDSLRVNAIAVAIGDNEVRAAVVSRLAAAVPHVRFPVLIHPTAVVSRFAKIGDGSVLCANSSIGPSTVVGRFCICNTASSLDHDGTMGDYASLGPGAVTGGGACIGPGAAVCIGATVAHGGLHIGEGSVLGANSLLLGCVPPLSVAYGSPARVVRERTSGDSYLHKPGSRLSVAPPAPPRPAAFPADSGSAAAASPVLELPPTKTAVTDLTLFNTAAPPSFPTFMHVGRPNLGPKAAFLALADDIWESRILTNDGPLVRRLEAEVAAFLRVKHFVACCNGTVALDIGARVLGWTGGGGGAEVIVPSYTFIASANVLQWAGVTPVFCDVDPRTHLIDAAAAEALVTPRTVGILGVHLWGTPCNVEALQGVAKRHGLRLMFDAAHAFGSSHAGL